MPLPHKGHTTVQDWISHQNKAAQKVQEHLQRGREARVKRVNWKRKPAQYSRGDYVLIHRNRFPSRPVLKGGAKDILGHGRYLVVLTTGSGIVKRCSPTLGGEVPVAHEYLNCYQFDLVDDQNPDAEDIETDTREQTDEAAALKEEADLVQKRLTYRFTARPGWVTRQLHRGAVFQGAVSSRLDVPNTVGRVACLCRYLVAHEGVCSC